MKPKITEHDQSGPIANSTKTIERNLG